MLKKISILIIAIAISGCSLIPKDDKQEVQILTDSQGNVVQTSMMLEPEQAMEMKQMEQSAKQEANYFSAKQALYSRVESGDIPMIIMAEALSGASGPTNFNDVLIAKEQSKVGISNNRWNFAKWAAGGYLLQNFSSDLFSFLGGAATGGIKINGDNNEVRGTNTGDNNVESGVYREEIGGVPVNPVDGEPIVFGGPEEEIATGSCTCPPGFEIRPGTTDICSDGNGGEVAAICPAE